MEIKEILERVREGKMDLQTAESLLAGTKLLRLSGGIVQFDLHRESRSGIPEVVYAESKTPETCKLIAENILKEKPAVMFTRLKEKQLKVLEVLVSNPENEIDGDIQEDARLVLLWRRGFIPKNHGGKVGIITAGTSDIPVAKEAEAVLRLMGSTVIATYDVGIAGLHRLFKPLKECLEEEVDVLIVIAGMEGALPSVVAGLVDIPVIGVPVSTGYGFGSGGMTALSSMLQSCSPGLAVVNIDSGFAAGAFAALISQKCSAIRNKNTL
ncbi:MAG: nickel pincer cofactor biosynthesis protein LarB [Candidatus Odinarchaeota archaeon]